MSPGRRARDPLLLTTGQQAAGGYLVERYLGEGAFAEVYRVRHRYLGRQAMKVFKRAAERGAVEETLSEAVLLSRLGHPNVVRVFDAGTVGTTAGERAYFTMEYVAGGNLERFWNAHRPRYLPVDDTVRILHQVSAGLALAHTGQPPVVHRDITPQNILIGYDGSGLRARLGDFGLATAANPLTQLVSDQGVEVFKAPEALLGRRGDSRAGDVWALGVIGYLLLTDRLPYPRGFTGWFTGEHRRAPPAPPSSLNPEVDEALERIVLGALHLDRGRRTPHAGALVEQFARWRAGHHPPRPPGGSARGTAPGGEEPARPPRPRGAAPSGATGAGQPAAAPGPDGVPVAAGVSEAGARALADRALVLARQAGTLPEAGDLMEEAVTASARLRGRYEKRLLLWRRGVVS